MMHTGAQLLHCRHSAKTAQTITVIMAILVMAAQPILAQVKPRTDGFNFMYQTGDKFRFISRVEEDVFINRRFSHSAEIVNRIAFEVADVRADGASLLKGDFSTSVRYGGGIAYVTDRIYQSAYWQLPNGRYDIADQYYMPTVRHVPTFPDRNLVPGDSWNASGEERHDFRSDFGIPDPYVIPIDVRYRYERDGEFKGWPVKVLSAAYTIFYRPGPPRAWHVAYPIQIAGYSSMLLYWNQEKGGLIGHESSFRFIFDLSDGRTIDYRGIADAEMIEAQLMDRESLADQVRDAVADLANVSVSSDERGVTISLDNIRFEADSTRLLPGQDINIKRIAEILQTIPDRDIQVSGHTALAGTAQARLVLSRERARTVADMLIALGARQAEQVTVIGYGAERPVADNSSEYGMARNRRVEITILEN
jgi:outer membrane protein OmpA-like peptidoglycan-associated protein